VPKIHVADAGVSACLQLPSPSPSSLLLRTPAVSQMSATLCGGCGEKMIFPPHCMGPSAGTIGKSLIERHINTSVEGEISGIAGKVSGKTTHVTFITASL